MKVYIYVLLCPITKIVKYVGKTNNIKRRYSQHTSRKCLERTGSKKLAYWILKLLNNSLLPMMEIIEECNEDNWQDREKYWISHYSNSGLCNLSTGGEGVGHTEASKEKIRISLTGRKRSKEEKEAISKALKGKKRPNSGKAISEFHKKRYENIEERRKQGIKLRKKVGQFDLDNNLLREFESAREASRQLNIDCGIISNCCRNMKNAKGFIFRYL